MKCRMMDAEEACRNETKREKMRRLKKEKAQKRAQDNSCEEAPSAPTTSCVNTKETNKKSKPKKSKEKPLENPCEHGDMEAHIATDMMQIQSVPKTQASSSYYKSKVNKEISLNNALIIIMPL